MYSLPGAETTGISTNMKTGHYKNLIATYYVEKTKGKAFEQRTPCLAVDHRRSEWLLSHN